MSAGLMIACGDDDDSNPITPTPDSGKLPDSSRPGEDSGQNDAGTDAPAEGGGENTAVTPKTNVELPNAIDPYGLVFASDGFLYASGSTDDGGTQKLAVWRFKDGALDTTFGQGGVVTVDIPGNEVSFDIVEVSPGNFVVQAVVKVGDAVPTRAPYDVVYLVKLTKGANDAFTFGTPKFVKFGYDLADDWTPPNPAIARPSYTSWGIGLDKSVAATPKIVVFGAGAPAKGTPQRTRADRWITRVLADTLDIDPGFNGGAPFTVDVDGADLGDNARRGIVLTDGSIVSSGYTNFGDDQGNHVVLIRLKADGTPDETFGFGVSDAGASPGQTKFNPFIASGGFAEAYSVTRQSTGRYVTTGYGVSNLEKPTEGVDLVSFGVKPDAIDPTYGKLGSFVVQSETASHTGSFDAGVKPWEDRGRDITVLPDDRVVHAGLYDNRTASVYVVDKDGKLDSKSGDAGALSYAWAQAFFRVVVSPDGKTIAATAKSLRPGNDAGAPLGSLLVTLKVGQ